MLQYVRIKAEATIDNPNALPLHFDVVIDDEGNVMGTAPIFGCEGEISRAGGDSQPFVLYDSGEMDYGLAFESPDRCYNLNLRQDRVFVGRILMLRGDSGFQESRRITQVKPLVPADASTQA
jgi:hypothetical protein